jgi:ribosomal protein L37AE/L43A
MQEIKTKLTPKKKTHKCTSCGCVITNRFSVARGTCRVCNDSAQQLEAFTVNDLVGDLELMLNPSGITQRHDYEGDYAFTFR